MAESMPAVPHGIFGKWHLGVSATEGGSDAPIDQCFDRAVVTDGNLTPHGYTYREWQWRRDGEPENWAGYITTETVDEAVAWINEQVGQWVANVWFHAPHGPAHCPPVELAPDCDDEDVLSQYRAMVAAMDADVSRLLYSIDLSSLLVIFISDNGSAPIVTLPPFDPSRSKHTVYEGGIRVPGIIWGDGVAAGESDAHLRVEDVPATVFTWVTGRDPVNGDGKDWSPLFADPGTAIHDVWANELGTFSPNGGGPYSQSERAVTDGRYKVVTRGGEESFFDLEEDPYEGNDLRGSLSPEEQTAYEAMREWALGLPN